MKIERDEKGNLPVYAWPGGYPIYYLVADDGILCPSCANTEKAVRLAEQDDSPDFDQWRIVAGDINWEASDLYCDNCNERIQSAYGEDE
jgi:hypothetical protein